MLKKYIPQSSKKIIVAPLFWGLGHATRCIPIIEQLINLGKEIIIASDGEALELLTSEFPHLPAESLPAYNVKYKGETLTSIILGNGSNVLSAMLRERRATKRLYKKYKPDLIISDSRFGFRHPSVKNIIITHQLYVNCKNPALRYFLNVMNTRLLNSFDACWIPDTSDHSLSGELSINSRVKNQSYIGPQSRLKKYPISNEMKTYDVAIILSGPEPARTKMESSLITHFGNSEKSFCLVRGTNKLNQLQLPKNWHVIPRANSSQINDILLGSKEIISRSGYTSIMDYAHLGIGAYLLPTPGQSEQEYLAESLNGKMGFKVWSR